MSPIVVVTMELDSDARAVLEEALAGAAQVESLAGREATARMALLGRADILLGHNPARDLSQTEMQALGGIQLIQLMTAGFDFVALGDLPAGVAVASNAGAYSEPMAEHALALTLAAAKRLLVEHAALARGEFNQRTRNRMLSGMVCGILGYGGIGRATARLMRCLGVKIHAINRSGVSDDALDWIGTSAQLETLLAAVDVLVISAPLTHATQGMLGARELALMKDDAILVNLARGEIIDEAALFAHLQAHPKFTACLDAWWVEPIRHGAFRLDHPFTALSNVIGSPHNSASVAQSSATALRMAGLNCRRQLQGEPVLNLIRPEDRYL
ncbi:MAG: NAD(P)-dependent oxidoreductase [Burkholderiaceae bacterium]